MNLRRQIRVAAALLASSGLGWVLYLAAAWVVGHDSVNYRIADAGFRFISNAAEGLLLARFGQLLEEQVAAGANGYSR